MKKSILYSIIAVMMFAFICMVCIWEVQSLEEKKGAESQRFEKTFEMGDIRLVVETDRTVYGLNDYVYVTASLFNHSEEPLQLSSVTSTRGVHEELVTVISQGNLQMIDVDTYLIDYPEDSGTITIGPGGRYAQVMRFSQRIFAEYHNAVTIYDRDLLSGIFQGTVTANAILDGEVKPLSVEFQIEMGD